MTEGSPLILKRHKKISRKNPSERLRRPPPLSGEANFLVLSLYIKLADTAQPVPTKSQKQITIGENMAPLKGVIPHRMGKCHEVTKGTAR